MLGRLVKRFGAHNRLVGVEVSEPMLQASREVSSGNDLILDHGVGLPVTPTIHLLLACRVAGHANLDEKA